MGGYWCWSWCVCFDLSFVYLINTGFLLLIVHLPCRCGVVGHEMSFSFVRRIHSLI